MDPPPHEPADAAAAGPDPRERYVRWAAHDTVLGSPFTHTRLGTTTPVLGPPDSVLSVGRIVACEWTAAAVTSLTISPAVCIIDRAVMQNAAGAHSLWPALRAGCVQLVRHPLLFARTPEFRLMWLVYFGTYAVANTTEGVYNHFRWPWASTKFVATSTANIGLTLYKDARYTRMFSRGQSRPLPLATLGAFTARDALTMLASFTLPDRIAEHLQYHSDWHPELCENLAQALLPCAVQWATTPLHLWGLHRYNAPGDGVAERLAFVRREFWKNLATRTIRIIPPFGIGGTVNRHLRTELKRLG